jgi:signal transduction histidine kinase
MTRARTVTDWREGDRKALGPRYLYQELAPMRESFVATAREIAALVRSLRQARNQAMADSVDEIQALVVRILSVAALFGLGLAAIATWRFRHFEKERDVHTQHLQEAEEGLRALSQRLVESQELERKKLSRELHDEIGQILTAMRVQLGQIEPAGEASQAHLNQVSDLADRSLRRYGKWRGVYAGDARRSRVGARAEMARPRFFEEYGAGRRCADRG